MAAPTDMSVPQQAVSLYPTIITSSSQIVIPSSTSQLIIPSSSSQIAIPSSPSVGGITVNAKKNTVPATTLPRMVTPSKPAIRQVATSVVNKPSDPRSQTVKASGNLQKASPNTSRTLSNPRIRSISGTPATAGKHNPSGTPVSKPSAKRPAVELQGAIAEKRASLLQELSKVMRDTANKVASSKKTNLVSGNKTETNTVGSPALQTQPKPNQPSPEKTTSLKQVAVPKTVLPKESVVIPSTTVSNNPSFVIPSVITSDVLGQMNVPLVPIISTSGNNCLQSQPGTNLLVEPAVTQCNNIQGSKESNSMVIQTESTQPTFIYTVNPTTTQQSSLTLPNPNQLYAIVPTPTVEVQPAILPPTIYGIPSVNSVPVAHVQNAPQVSVGGIPSTNILNAGSGTMFFAIVGNQGIVAAPSAPLTIENSVPMVVEQSEKSIVNKVELVKQATESKQSDPLNQFSAPGKDTPVDHQPSVESSQKYKDLSNQELRTGGIFSDPMEETELAVEEPTEEKETENNTPSRTSVNPSVIDKLDRELKRSDDVTSLRQPQEKALLEKQSEENGPLEKQSLEDVPLEKRLQVEALLEKKNKKRLDQKSTKAVEGTPKKLTAVDVVKNQLKRVQALRSELPPKKSYISISPNDCQKLSDMVEETSNNLKNIYEDLKSFNEINSSSYIPSDKADMDRGQILCRLCAGFFKREALIRLYTIGSDDSHLVKMINSVVPESMHVQALDGLPQDICKHCSDKLNGCYQIINGFLEADKKLREILGLQAKSPREEIPKKHRVREEMKAGKLTTYTTSPQRKKRPRGSSLDGMTSDSDTHHQPKRRPEHGSSESIPVDSIDYSRFDPEYDVGFEVEWCLDEETIRSTLGTTSEVTEPAGGVGQSECALRTSSGDVNGEAEEATVRNTEEELPEPVGDKHMEPAGDKHVESAGGKVVEPAGDKVVEPAGDKVVEPAGDKFIESAGDNVEPAGDKIIEPAGDKVVESAGDKVVEPAGDKPVEPAGDKSVKPAGDKHVEPAGDKSVEHAGDKHRESRDGEHMEPAEEEHMEYVEEEHTEIVVGEFVEMATSADGEVPTVVSSEPHLLPTLACSDSNMAKSIPETSSCNEPSLPSDKESVSHLVPVDKTVAAEQKEEGDHSNNRPDEHQVENI